MQPVAMWKVSIIHLHGQTHTSATATMLSFRSVKRLPVAMLIFKILKPQTLRPRKNHFSPRQMLQTVLANAITSQVAAQTTAHTVRPVPCVKKTAMP